MGYAEDGMYRLNQSSSLEFPDGSECFEKCATDEYSIKDFNKGEHLYIYSKNGMLMISNIHHYYGINDINFNKLFRKYGLTLRPQIHQFNS